MRAKHPAHVTNVALPNCVLPKEGRLSEVLADCPHLTVGPPGPTDRYTADELSDLGYVGLYDVTCSVCKKRIQIVDRQDADEWFKGGLNVTHFRCLPEEKQRELPRSPYILSPKEAA